jgi:hypothetical protein
MNDAAAQSSSAKPKEETPQGLDKAFARSLSQGVEQIKLGNSGNGFFNGAFKKKTRHWPTRI